MTGPGPVRPLTARQRALLALADELTPAKSLVRLDAATARVVTTVSVVGTLLTGFGLLTAGLPDLQGAARVLAVCSMLLAFLAVVCALSAQMLTVTRGLNTNNLKEVERWYQRRFEIRAPLASAASVLLVLAVAAAGAAAGVAIAGGTGHQPSLVVTRISQLTEPAAARSGTAAPLDSVSIDVTFRAVDAGQAATVMVAVDNRMVAQAALTPTPQGVVTRTLTVDKIPATGTVTVRAQAGPTRCTAEGSPGRPLYVNCTGH